MSALAEEQVNLLHPHDPGNYTSRIYAEWKDHPNKEERAYADMIREAGIFQLPNEGNIMDVKELDDPIHLPYNITCLEFAAELLEPDGKPHQARVHCMAMDGVYLEDLEGLTPLNAAPLFACRFTILTARGCFLFPRGSVAYSMPVTPKSPSDSIKIHGNDGIKRELVYQVVDRPGTEHDFDSMPEGESDLGSMMVAFTYPVVCIVKMLQMSNVGIDRVPSPPKLNKARIARGKPPLFDYHVLTIRERPNAPRANGQGGHHASPRTHTRRGHVRHLDSKNVWVRSALINPGHGFLSKSYAMPKFK